MPGATYTVATLELSQAAYDEIEKKLLDAGYTHVFERGPGSAIDMSGIAVTREPTKALVSEMLALRGRATDPVSVEMEAVLSKLKECTAYCFACDRMVKEPCERPFCLQRVSEQAREMETVSMRKLDKYEVGADQKVMPEDLA